MLPLPKHITLFLLIAYGFSFVFWISAWLLSSSFGIDVLVNNEIYFWNGEPQVLLVSLLFSIATLGPLIAALVVRKQSNITVSTQGFGISLSVFALLFTVQTVITLVFWLVARDSFSSSNLTLGAVLFAVMYFALTSGTEEFGWRGVLYPHVQKHTKSLWDSAFVTGLIWGPWHTPFVLFAFVTAGMPLSGIVLSYAGFIMSIVLMSYLHGFIYVRGASTLANYLLHTLHNWFPVVVIFVFGESGMASLTLIVAYVVTMLILERFFPSQRFFEARSAEPVRH